MHGKSDCIAMVVIVGMGCCLAGFALVSYYICVGVSTECLLFVMLAAIRHCYQDMNPPPPFFIAPTTVVHHSPNTATVH